MRYRLLGPTGLRVSETFLGTLGFGTEWGLRADEARRVVDSYVDAGGNVIDTASSYGEGQSETIVGESLRGRRDRLVVATKYTWTRDGRDPNGGGNHRKSLRLSLEASLRRLGTDHVDLLWVQMWDRHTPLEETMRALDDVVRAGKVLYVGFSDAPAWVVARANALAEWHGWTPFAAIQVPYSLLNRDIERELLPMAEGLGLTVAAWGPLAHGALTGSHRDPSVTPDERDRAVARTVQHVAGELGATAAQVAIAWTRARSRAVHPIVGPLTVGHLEDSLGALDVRLPDDALRRLDESTGFSPGHPEAFIEEATPWVLGEVAERVDGRSRA